jgi:hypothetical protein
VPACACNASSDIPCSRNRVKHVWRSMWHVNRASPARRKKVAAHVLRHYVDGWVMWPPGVFPLLTGVSGLVAAT